MSRIIATNRPSKERNKLLRLANYSVRQLLVQDNIDDNTKDISSFIALILWEVNRTVELSVTAWEKRGYWVKGDRFRLEGLWTGKFSKLLTTAILKNHWKDVNRICTNLLENLSNYCYNKNMKIDTPWKGSF